MIRHRNVTPEGSIMKYSIFVIATVVAGLLVIHFATP
jgi:hypothetical protein